MTATANPSWKLDDGLSYAVNCFPARGINRGTHEGAGSWIVAYANEQQGKLEHIFKSAKDDEKVKKVDKTKEFLNNLTEDFLINHHHVDSASDLCSVNICDCELESKEDVTFLKFDNVAYINAAENLLSLRTFSTFPSLRELELPVNGIRNIELKPGDFPSLQVLDLSYNNLSPTDVLALRVLPKLKVLTLTGNGLTQIHPNLCLPYTNEFEETQAPFQKLEVLLLDDNHLKDMATFAALAALPNLVELNLDKNEINLVPYLKVMGEKILSETHSISHPHSSNGRKSNLSRSSSKKSKKGSKASSKLSLSPKTESRPISPKQSDDEPSRLEIKSPEAKAADKNPSQNDPTSQNSVNEMDTAITTDISFDTSSTPPFPRLKILSLASNKIAEEEHLLAVSAWPELRALILHGNPLVTKNKGEPPLLSHYLKKRLGISIVRFKPKAPVLKPPLRVPPQDKRVISSHVPKLPKQPINALVEALRKPALNSTPDIKPKNDGEIPSSDAKPNEEISDKDNVFLTQLQDEDTEYAQVSKTIPIHTSTDTKDIKPVRPTETMEDILKDAKPDPDTYENLSIQGNVKVLRRILQHPLSVAAIDSLPEKRLNKFQYRDRPAGASQKDIRLLPKPDAKSRRHQQIEEALLWMRNKPAIAVELPLVTALNQTQDQELKVEAELLLRRIEAKYRVVREESLKASRRAHEAMEDTKKELERMKDVIQ